MHLQLQDISKNFSGVKALTEVSLQVVPGEVHALCGENGAGKSTLMNILTGNIQPDAGQLIWNGQPVRILYPGQATQLGIAMVYQQLSLVDALSVAENIFANQAPLTRWGWISYSGLFAQTRQLLNQLRISDIHPETPVSRLSPGQKQMVEIAKALSRKPDLLILDEPTASITERETQVLFDLIRQLKAEGKSVIYISHRMKEIFRIADRITVLKDGHYQGTRTIAEISPPDLIRLMVGRNIGVLSRQSAATTKELLQVTNLSGNGFRNVHFTLHQGEILGLAGLVGAGRTEIAQAIFGLHPWQSGEVRLKGKALILRHPADAVAQGIGYVPEERKSLGVFPEMSVASNVVAASLRRATKGFWFDAATANQLARHFRERLRITTPDVQQSMAHLSGGNQQKVVLSRWLLANPDVLMVDEPTHGIDVGAKAEIYELLWALAAEGKGILLISSELSELMALSDRILVIREGRISGELAGNQATEEAIMALATVA